MCAHVCLLAYTGRHAYMANTCLSRAPSIQLRLGGSLSAAEHQLDSAQLSTSVDEIEALVNGHGIWRDARGMLAQMRGVGRPAAAAATVTVQCTALRPLLEQIGQRTIDFFSLDVEGTDDRTQPL